MLPILLSTSYFPPVSWMASAIQAKSTTIEIHETYPKQTYRNRCHIATSSGILGLTVPVKKVNGNHTKTADIQIDYSTNWPQLHWRSVVTAYNKSPYFLYYRDIFEPVFLKKPMLLVELNHEILIRLFTALDNKHAELIYTREYELRPQTPDYRNAFHPKIKPGVAGSLDFPRYIQVFEEKLGFLPDLSIMDLLFNLGPESIGYLRNIKLQTIQTTNVLPDIRS